MRRFQETTLGISESKRLVQQAVDRVTQGATSLVIAHRLSGTD